MRGQTEERSLPNKLRLRRGGGGGVGGCGVFAPRLEMSTSTRETVSPEARKVAEKERTSKKRKTRMLPLGREMRGCVV